MKKLLFLSVVFSILGVAGLTYADPTNPTVAPYPPGIGSSESVVEPLNLGDTDADLVYTPVTPCRIIDTRLMVIGAFTNGETRDFYVSGTTNFPAQGGNTGGCGIPDGATAVMINFIAVGPTAGGDIRTWAYGGSQPFASTINFAPVSGLNIANAVIQPICNPAVTTCTYDMRILAEGASLHVVADVLGYFRYPGSPSYRTTFTFQSIPAVGSPAGQLATLTYTPLSTGTVYARSRGYCNMDQGATQNAIYISAGTSESDAYNTSVIPVSGWGVIRIPSGPVFSVAYQMMWSSERAIAVTEGVPITINLYGKHQFGNWVDDCSGSFSIDKRF